MKPGATRAVRGLATMGLVAGLSLTATPTHADPVPPPGPAGPAVPETTGKAGSTYVYGTAKDTSSKRKKLGITVSSSVSSGAGSLAVSLGLGDERHSWSFDMPGKDLKVNAKGGGTLKTKATGPYGTVSLKLAPQGKWKVRKCKGVVEAKTRVVVLKGAFLFDSKGAWGKVGSKRSFSLKGSVTRYTGKSGDCYQTLCPTVSGGGYYSNGSMSISTYWSGGKASLSGSRSVSLPKPKGAYRYDYRSVSIPVPDLVPGEGEAAQLKIKGGKKAKGSATLSADSRFASDSQCKGDTYTNTFWSGAQYTNGGTPLTLRMTAFGDIKLPNGSGASFNRTTKN